MVPYLPFFVYGTLLPGQPNYYLWEKQIVAQQKATLTNGRLYDLGHYPMLIEIPGEQVSGRLVTIRREAYTTVLNRLDRLEGFSPDRPDESEYRRVQREVITASDTAVSTWVYIGQNRFVHSLPIVKNGDWVTYVQYKQAHIDRWWQEIDASARQPHEPGENAAGQDKNNRKSGS